MGYNHIDSLGNQRAVAIGVRYFADAHPGEPFLVVRGRDHLALPTITAYRTFAGIVAGTIGLTGPVMDAVGLDFEQFRQWQGEFPGLLKYPDR